MVTITTRSYVGEDGIIRLEVPTSFRDTDVEISLRWYPVASEPIEQRTPGLNEGEIWISDDFDAPLPDSFWLGEE